MTTKIRVEKKLQLLKAGALILSFFIPLQAHSFEIDLADWTINIYGGIGGMGIQKQVDKDGEILEARKGESPGMLGVDMETFTSDRWRFTIGHRRGVRIGPISSGVGFTGVSWNYYPLSSPPRAVDFVNGNYIADDGYSSFIGISTGIAHGTITRESDEVPSVTSSGVYVGIRAGVDYSWAPGVIIRPEILGSQTIYDTGNLASSLNEFGIMCGIVFHFPDWFMFKTHD